LLPELAVHYGSDDREAVETTLVLLRLATDISLALGRYLDHYGLSEGRLTLLGLLLLSPRGGMEVTPSILADRAGVTRGTITGLLDGLERDWLIRRTPHPTDRRSLSVQLTRQGRALLHLIVPEHLRRVAHLTERLSPGERKKLVHTLTAIRAGLADL
jgi:DNA-binding MarR family transcriptional regulator